MNEKLVRTRELEEKLVNKIVITNDGSNDYFNYVYMPVTESDISLIDLSTGYAYAKYNSLDDLNRNIEDGYIKTIEGVQEPVKRITNIRELRN